MSEKKKIPCRVCGKLFEPCSTCQSDNRMFRWRNFACSLKCAEKYINETIAFRESQKKKDISVVVNAESDLNTHQEISKKKYTKKNVINNVEIVKEESEQID